MIDAEDHFIDPGTVITRMKVLEPGNPTAIRSPSSWVGALYVLHGLAGVSLVGLIIVRIYFAVRPETQFLTRSMFFG